MLAPVSSPSRAELVGSRTSSSPASPPSAGTATTAPSVSKAPLLNPDPVIDPRLGIVVLHYFNRDGVLTATTPSARQLQAYQLAGATTPDPA